MQQSDFETTLAEGLLTKADRAGMGCALELRAPFLDVGVMEFAASLPPAERVSGLTTKTFLKRYARRYLPDSLIDRRKRGLSVPLAVVAARPASRLDARPARVASSRETSGSIPRPRSPSWTSTARARPTGRARCGRSSCCRSGSTGWRRFAGRHGRLRDQPTRRYRYYDLVMAAFVTVLLCANLIGPAKVAKIGPFTFGAGVLFFPISYIFGDVLTEVYGYARARKVVWAGFAARDVRIVHGVRRRRRFRRRRHGRTRPRTRRCSARRGESSSPRSSRSGPESSATRTCWRG